MYISFTLSTSEVDKYCFISKILSLVLTSAYSLKDIASNHNISFNTVSRILNSFTSHLNISNLINILADTLFFDEFKSVKNTNGKMSFIFMDAYIDIVENRQLSFLEKYFQRYTQHARDNVKEVVIDMYNPYILLIKKMFKHAKITFDRFHVINHLNRALNKARIELMKKDKVNYNKLKRYWRLLLTNRNKLNNYHYNKSRCFNRMMIYKQIVDYLINLDETFKITYEYYQDFIQAFEFKDSHKINQLSK